MRVAKKSNPQTIHRNCVRRWAWSCWTSSVSVGNELSVSPRKPTSIDVEDCTIHVVRIARGEEETGAGDVLGLGPGALRDAGEDRGAAGGIFAQGAGVLRLD